MASLVDTPSTSASRVRIQNNYERILGPVYRDDLFASRLGVDSSPGTVWYLFMKKERVSADLLKELSLSVNIYFEKEKTYLFSKGRIYFDVFQCMYLPPILQNCVYE